MYYIIVNPASKTGKGGKIWTKLQAELANRKVVYKLYLTTGLHDATLYAREITRSITTPITLIVLGGDGTINEVIQGIENKELVHVGYIPTGSSNDLARDLGLSNDPFSQLDLILTHARATYFDIGMVSYPSGSQRLFAVGCGIGFDAAVCAEALHSPIKNMLNHLKLGKLTYLGIALKQILKAPNVSCSISLDGGEELFFPHFLFIASMIHRYEGGGFMFCPDASATDGLLDICVAGNLSALQAIHILPHAFTGNHLRFPEVFQYRCKSISIKTSVPLWVQTDGEVQTKASEISLTNIKSAVQFIW